MIGGTHQIRRVAPSSTILKKTNDVKIHRAGGYADNAKMIVDGSDSAGDMSAVTITILVPWEIDIVTSDRNTLQVFMGDQESNVNDTDSTV